MHGMELGRRSLQFDAVYCAVAGTVVAALRRRVGPMIGLPPARAAAGGLATIAWSGALAVLSRHTQRRWPVVAVGSANTAAAVGLMSAGIRHRHPVARLVLVAVGLQVAAFALSQAAALRAPAPSSPAVT